MNKTLMDKKEVLPYLAELFASSVGGLRLGLQVREDTCFEGSDWLSLGEIELQPPSIEEALLEGDTSSKELIRLSYVHALERGQFDWHCPEMDRLHEDCARLLGIVKGGEVPKDPQAWDTMRRALESIIDVAARTLLQYPVFDPESLSEMPFRRPKTIVCDTNSILKGALDFCARFLFPMARIKIPAIVHMEIVNQTDRFLKERRSAQRKELKPAKRAQALLEHVTSQAGQRALLRLELHTDVEIERNPLFPDPLREAFAPERGGEFQDLNLSQPVRSYCDRLILETARTHQSTVTSGHDVFLLTSDEGLGRMLLAEGFKPLFFHGGRPRDMFGHCWTGTAYSPFKKQIVWTSMVDVLWELAVTFGQARLLSADGRHHVEVTAMDENLQWLPFHAKNDLLMVSVALGGEGRRGTDIPSRRTGELKQAQGPAKPTQKKVRKPPPSSGRIAPVPEVRTAKSHAFPIYEINAEILLEVAERLADRGSIDLGFKGTALASQSVRTQRNYIGFLKAGGFATIDSSELVAGDAALRLMDAIRGDDRPSVAEALHRVPSYAEFVSGLPSCPKDLKGEEIGRRLRAYWVLGDAAGEVLFIPERGAFRTNVRPSVASFSEIAMDIYTWLAKGDSLVLTGEWLEHLAMTNGIHPLLAQSLTVEANVSGELQVTTEGSTPEVSYPGHNGHRFVSSQGNIGIEKYNLYYGDFLISGKASVGIRLKRGRA